MNKTIKVISTDLMTPHSAQSYNWRNDVQEWVGGVRLIAAGQKISGNNLIGGILSLIWEGKNKNDYWQYSQCSCSISK